MTARPTKRRRLVGYDGSWSARRALDFAAELHRNGDAMSVVFVDERGNAQRDPLGDACRRLAEQGIEATPILLKGDPASAICMTAEEQGYDTIVVGRRNFCEGGLLELGSVSARVVAGAVGHVVVVA